MLSGKGNCNSSQGIILYTSSIAMIYGKWPVVAGLPFEKCDCPTPSSCSHGQSQPATSACRRASCCIQYCAGSRHLPTNLAPEVCGSSSLHLSIPTHLPLPKKSKVSGILKSYHQYNTVTARDSDSVSSSSCRVISGRDGHPILFIRKRLPAGSPDFGLCHV